MDNVLEVKALSKSYTDFTLKNISFNLPEGFIMGLIGPNGSGKTTTIRSILNMAAPDKGVINVFGKDNILDEPTSGLDPVSRDELLEILSDYIEDGKHSVLFSTHITSDLEKIADYITFVNLGKLIFTGSKEEFVESYRIVSGDKKALMPELEKKLIGTRTFATGFEALIRTQDMPEALHSQAVNATIDDIVVFVSRQSEKEKEERK